MVDPDKLPKPAGGVYAFWNAAAFWVSEHPRGTMVIAIAAIVLIVVLSRAI